MARDFYPFVEEGADEGGLKVAHPARIAVFDDAAAAPRVVVVEPKDVRDYLEEITQTVSRLAKEQGGTIPFMVIREVVENFIHAYFQAPTITILDDGCTIRFADQGPGIAEKDLALEYGTTSATEEMRRYIRGVGSGLPYVQQYMADKGGSLEIEDNIQGGTVVTISTRPVDEARVVFGSRQQEPAAPRPQARGAAFPQPQATVAPAPPERPDLGEKGELVVAFLAERPSCGPTDLTRAYGSSGPTWSRALQALAAQGVVRKEGQKYVLTGYGRTLV